MPKVNKYDKDGDGELSKEEEFLLKFDELAIGDDAQEEEFPFGYLHEHGYEGKLTGLKHPSVQQYNGERCALVEGDENSRFVTVKLQDHDLQIQVTKHQITVVKDPQNNEIRSQNM